MLSESPAKEKTGAAVKVCYARAQFKSRALDPRLQHVRKVGACTYEVDSSDGQRVYTVTVTKEGYRCNCPGADHPACHHRASAFRLRLVERSAHVVETPQPVNTPPRRPSLEEMYDLDDAKRAAAGVK